MDGTAPKPLEQVVVTNVLGASLCQQNGRAQLIDDKIEIFLSNKNGRYEADKSSAKCVYWDTATRDWSSDGCQVMPNNG